MDQILQPQRLQHEIKLRTLTVKKIEDLSPVYRKITFYADDLDQFKSASPDDHVKVFFPDPITKNVSLPIMEATGPKWPDGAPDPIMRDYTPIEFNPDHKTLSFIFFKHKNGVGCTWAQEAKINDPLYIAGPRGSLIVPNKFDWYLIISDESGLPSITRRLKELPKESRIHIFLELEKPSDLFEFEKGSQTVIHTLYREGQTQPGQQTLFLKALKDFKFPNGSYFSWIKTESLCALKIKNYLLKEKQTDINFIKASGYWKNNL